MTSQKKEEFSFPLSILNGSDEEETFESLRAKHWFRNHPSSNYSFEVLVDSLTGPPEICLEQVHMLEYAKKHAPEVALKAWSCPYVSAEAWFISLSDRFGEKNHEPHSSDSSIHQTHQSNICDDSSMSGIYVERMDSSPPSHQVPIPSREDVLYSAKEAEEEESLIGHRSIPGLGTILQCGKTVIGDSFMPKISASPGLDTTNYVGQINRMFNDSLQTFEKSQVGETFFKNNPSKQPAQILPQTGPVVTKTVNFNIFHDPYGTKTSETFGSPEAKRILTENNSSRGADHSSLLSANPLLKPESIVKLDSLVDHLTVESMRNANTMSTNTTLTPCKTTDTTKPQTESPHVNLDGLGAAAVSAEVPNLSDTCLFEQLNQPNILGNCAGIRHGNLSMLNSPTTLMTEMLDLISKNPRSRNRFP